MSFAMRNVLLHLMVFSRLLDVSGKVILLARVSINQLRYTKYLSTTLYI